MISAEVVEQTWRRINAMNEEQVQELADQMRAEQPELLEHLMELSEQAPFDEEDGEIFFNIGVVVWQIMRQGPQPLPKVTHDDLNNRLLKHAGFLGMLISDTPGDFMSAIKTMLEKHPELEVLRYIAAAIRGPDEPLPGARVLRQTSHSTAMLYLKTLLDVLSNNWDEG